MLQEDFQSCFLVSQQNARTIDESITKKSRANL
jgi:hypothetical protein